MPKTIKTKVRMNRPFVNNPSVPSVLDRGAQRVMKTRPNLVRQGGHRKPAKKNTRRM